MENFLGREKHLRKVLVDRHGDVPPRMGDSDNLTHRKLQIIYSHLMVLQAYYNLLQKKPIYQLEVLKVEDSYNYYQATRSETRTNGHIHAKKLPISHF